MVKHINLVAAVVLSVSSLALAASSLELSSIVGTAPVDMLVDNGSVQIGFEIDGQDTFPFDTLLHGTVSAGGALVVDGEQFDISGTEEVPLLGKDRLVQYRFYAPADIVGTITPYYSDMNLHFNMAAELKIKWDDGKNYTCKGTSQTIYLESDKGTAYSQKTGKAVLKDDFLLPEVTCTGYRGVTASSIQAAINAVIGANPETTLSMPVALNPILTQAKAPTEPEASCGSHPSGSSWTTLDPSCAAGDPYCDLLYCTCDDGRTTCESL